MASGSYLLYIHNGKVKEYQGMYGPGLSISKDRTRIMESSGKMGHYFTVFSEIKNGEIKPLYELWMLEELINEELYYTSTINGEEISEKEHSDFIQKEMRL